MNVVDSSGSLKFSAEGENAEFLRPAIEAKPQLIVPTINVLEVFKGVLQQRGENDALRAVVLMQQDNIADLDVTMSLSAAVLGREHTLPRE